jgi:Mg2+/Co2+ transporter CorC
MGDTMSKMAEVFAALTEEEQIRIAQSYLSNELLNVATSAASGAMTDDREMDLLVRVVELSSHKLVDAMPDEQRLNVITISQQIRELIKVQVAVEN